MLIQLTLHDPIFSTILSVGTPEVPLVGTAKPFDDAS